MYLTLYVCRCVNRQTVAHVTQRCDHVSLSECVCVNVCAIGVYALCFYRRDFDTTRDIHMNRVHSDEDDYLIF